MKLLVITSLKHKASKNLIKFLKFKKIIFDCVDTSSNRKIKITKNYDFLISFLNPVYINKSIRNKIKKKSYNFHPGPPEYPGFGCYNFAMLNKAKFYGSTVHEINDKFDNGRIIDVKTFKISYEKLTLDKLIKFTHKNLVQQSKLIISRIISGKKIIIKKKINWKRKAFTKKEFEMSRKISFTDTKKDIVRKIKAFSYKNYKSVYILYKGFKFEFKK